MLVVLLVCKYHPRQTPTELSRTLTQLSGLVQMHTHSYELMSQSRTSVCISLTRRDVDGRHEWGLITTIPDVHSKLGAERDATKPPGGARCRVVRLAGIGENSDPVA